MDDDDDDDDDEDDDWVLILLFFRGARVCARVRGLDGGKVSLFSCEVSLSMCADELGGTACACASLFFCVVWLCMRECELEGSVYVSESLFFLWWGIKCGCLRVGYECVRAGIIIFSVRIIEWGCVHVSIAIFFWRMFGRVDV